MPWPAIACVACLLGCQQPEVIFHTPDTYPARLSEWGLLRLSGDRLQLAPRSHVYGLNTPLFSDYALKLRTLYLPQGQAAQYAEFEAFKLPTGSIITKTFMYSLDATGAVNLDASWDGNPQHLDMGKTQLIETRLLVKQADGWDALAYIWQGDDAYLNITGELITLATVQGTELGTELNYLVPSRNQCASCHATDHTSGVIKPIGIKARHLHRLDPVHQQNQLSAWQQRGQLQGLPELASLSANASWDDSTTDLSHSARSYLDINCGHCHNPQGPADTSGLLLDYQAHPERALGLCKPPIAAGRGTGGHLYSIVPGSAATSILSYRLNTTDPATMMPELGRSLVHTQGFNLVSSWIDSMSGTCL